MKKIIALIIVTISLTGCRSCSSDYSQRKAGVQKVCPGCIYTRSEMMDIAQDTTKNPNIIYKVDFCTGGFYYNAWDVNYLTRIQ